VAHCCDRRRAALRSIQRLSRTEPIDNIQEKGIFKKKKKKKNEK
jgi:hypothetical protein